MTTRQIVLEILDEPNPNLVLPRLLDLIESEKERSFETGEKAGRHGKHWEQTIGKLVRA